MTIKVDQESSSPGNQSHRAATIDDLAAAFFVDDLQRALSAMGCTPDRIESSGICLPFDTAHEYVTAGPCFGPADENPDDYDVKPSIPSKIEVLFDGESDTIMSTSVCSGSIGSGSSYESFRRIEVTSRNCAQANFLKKCLHPEK